MERIFIEIKNDLTEYYPTTSMLELMDLVLFNNIFILGTHIGLK